MQLTWILGVLWTNILIARVQDILVHEGRSRRNLPEKAHLDRLADFHPLAFLHKDLPCVLASVAAVKTRDTVLLRMISLLEGLQRGHQVMASCYTVRNHPLGDSGSHGTFDDGSDRVHRPDYLGLILRRDVEFDLLEKILRGTEATNDKDILQYWLVFQCSWEDGDGGYKPEVTCSALESL